MTPGLFSKSHRSQLPAPFPNNVNIPRARAWIGFCDKFGDRAARRHLAAELDAALKPCVAARAHGRYAGMEAEICRQAMSLLFERILAANKELLSATAERDCPAIADQIGRSMFAAIKLAQWSLINTESMPAAALNTRVETQFGVHRDAVEVALG